MLVKTMAKLGQRIETTSDINHNERLEYLGDAVVEYITSLVTLFNLHTLLSTFTPSSSSLTTPIYTHVYDNAINFQMNYDLISQIITGDLCD